MEFRHLRSFLAVARHLHFGDAAVDLGIAQPALSLQIKELEADLGVALFQRTSRRVTITAAGEVFEQETLSLLNHLRAASEAARRAGNGTSGVLRLGLTGAPINLALTRAFRSFEQLNPAVSIVSRSLPPSEQVLSLERGLIDIAYVLSTGVELNEGLNFKVVEEWRWFLATPDSPHWLERKTVHVQDIKDELFVMYTSRPAEPNAYALLQGVLGYLPRRISFVHTAFDALSMAVLGSGIAIIPEAVTSFRLPGLRVLPLEGAKVTGKTLLAWHSGYLSPVGEACLDHLRQYLFDDLGDQQGLLR